MNWKESAAALHREPLSVSRRDCNLLLLSGAAMATLPPSLSGCATRTEVSQSRDGLKRSSPEAQGVDSRSVLAFLDGASAAGIELNSFMLYRRGHVIAEGWWWPYRADRLHMMHSFTKSVTACGVGLAIAEGRFGLDDKVVSFFPQERPAHADTKLAAMSVRDLLTMQSGHAEFVSGSVWRQLNTSWVAEFFKIPMVYQPGTHFLYSSAPSYMLSAIVTKTTGRTLRDYLEPRFFQPLGINHLEWQIGPDGVNPGGNGLSWTTADALKLGILHLQNGRWKERQILPAHWVRAATSSQVSNGNAATRGPQRNYGYHWWIGPANTYYAAGAFGQYSVVFPEQDAVLALTAGTDPQRLDPLIWKHFPAAFGVETSKANSADRRALAERCANLRLLPPLIASRSALESQISGQAFAMEPNEDAVTALRFEFTAKQCGFFLRDARGEHKITVGLEDWVEGMTTMTGNKLHHEYQPDSLRVVAGGRWLDERTFEMTWQFVETAFRDHIVCRFRDGTMTFDRSVNINSAATSLPRLSGARSAG